MSVNQRINRIVSRNTKMGAKAKRAGQVLASFYAENSKDEFAIDYLTRYGNCLIEHQYSADNPISAEIALAYVMDSVDTNYVPSVKSPGITEARILTYVMEMGLMFNETLADPENVLAIMAAMIDVAMRVNTLNKTNKVDDSWKVSINKAIGVTARLGYRKATYKHAYVDAYALASEAMEQLDGDRGEYGSVVTLVDELYPALNPEFKPADSEPKIIRFTAADFDDDDDESDAPKPNFFGGSLWSHEQPAVLRKVSPKPEDDAPVNPFDKPLWND